MFAVFPAGSMITTGMAFTALISGIINNYLMPVACWFMTSFTGYSCLAKGSAKAW